MAGRLAPTAGTVVRSPYAKVGYFAQHRVEQLDPLRTPLELVRGVAPHLREQEIRDHLGGFGFADGPTTSRIAPLSGGEKTRLALALLILERPNLLLLDEPTNHLDLDMRHAHAAALQAFSGALALVSHDRHLLRACERRPVACRGCTGCTVRRRYRRLWPVAGGPSRDIGIPRAPDRRRDDRGGTARSTAELGGETSPGGAAQARAGIPSNAGSAS